MIHMHYQIGQMKQDIYICIQLHGHLNVTFTARILWCVFISSVCTQPMRYTYARYTHRIALTAARSWDVRCAYATCAVNTQWSSSHTRHHTQWHRHSYTICAACASPMRHWYAVDTQHMRNSSAGDVPPNHLGDLAAYLLFFCVRRMSAVASPASGTGAYLGIW